MPAFSPTIGKFGDVTPRGKPWALWYKRYRKRVNIGLASTLAIAVIATGWWYFYGRSVPAPGGILNEGIVGHPQSLNPLFIHNDIDAEITPLIFRGLLRYDQKNELVPDLAEEVIVNEDGTSYDIKLGQHTWHDGTQVTAQDIAFTIRMTQDKEYQGPWSGSFTDVKVEIKNANNLTLTLEEPYAPFQQSLTIGILPEHILGGTTATELATSEFNRNPIGTGKLKFESLQTEAAGKQISQLQFELLDGYIETVRFHFYNSLHDAMTDFKLGELQTLWTQYDKQLTALDDFDKKEKYTTLNGQTYGLFFNTQSSNSKDSKARQALALALPKREAIKSVFNNHATVADSLYHEQSWAYSSDIETYNFNLDEAKKTWEDVENKPTSITLLIPKLTMHIDMANEIAEAWRELGINVSIRSEEGSEVGKIVDSGTGYDVVLLGEKVSQDPDRYSNWHSTQAPPVGLNISRLKNDRVDKALEDGRLIIDREERKVKYATFQDYLARDAAVIWLYRPNYVYMWSNKLHGVKIDQIWNEYNRFNTLEDWYINLAKRS